MRKFNRFSLRIARYIYGLSLDELSIAMLSPSLYLIQRSK